MISTSWRRVSRCLTQQRGLLTGLADVLQDGLTWLWFKAIRRQLCAALWRGSMREFQLPMWKPVCVQDDIRNPFPEEMNRLLTTRLTSLHFPATAVGGREFEDAKECRAMPFS